MAEHRTERALPPPLLFCRSSSRAPPYALSPNVPPPCAPHRVGACPSNLVRRHVRTASSGSAEPPRQSTVPCSMAFPCRGATTESMSRWRPFGPDDLTAFSLPLAAANFVVAVDRLVYNLSLPAVFLAREWRLGMSLLCDRWPSRLSLTKIILIYSRGLCRSADCEEAGPSESWCASK